MNRYVLHFGKDFLMKLETIGAKVFISMSNSSGIVDFSKVCFVEVVKDES